MRHHETQIHIAIVYWIKTVSPSTFCFHPANGGLRSKREAAKLRAMGVVAGVFDLVLICEAPGPELAFLEVKAPGETLNPNQKLFRARLDEMGVPYAIVRSIDETREFFRANSIRTREAMAGVA